MAMNGTTTTSKQGHSGILLTTCLLAMLLAAVNGYASAPEPAAKPAQPSSIHQQAPATADKADSRYSPADTKVERSASNDAPAQLEFGTLALLALGLLALGLARQKVRSN